MTLTLVKRAVFAGDGLLSDGAVELQYSFWVLLQSCKCSALEIAGQEYQINY